MLTAKRTPLYITLCLILAVIVMALFAILVQSRAQTGALWASQAAALYAQSIDNSRGSGDRLQILARSRAAMLRALQNDPYNTAHWFRLSVIDAHNQNVNASASSAQFNPSQEILKYLNRGRVGRFDDNNILPLLSPKPATEPD